MKNRINLGDTVKDKMTGVQGVVVGITHWLTGCDHIGVKRLGLDKDKQPWDMLWFDEPMLKLIKAAPKVKTEITSKPGGPVPNGR